jgi:NADPH:quinone reductase-like Zn-dependent oxidoreductase
VAKPVPKAGELLIKIHAATLNRTDCGFRDPRPFIVRFFSGMFRPKKNILGSEFAGEIEETGREVKLFKKDDKVFGLTGDNFGAHAEYICLPEDGSVAVKPANMAFEEAAAVCDGAMLALAYIKEINFKDGTKILINGASGSIGTAAVQLAKYYGAEVTAVCSTKNIDLIKSLGADNIIDYLKEDFTKIAEKYDVVFDAVGKSSFFKCKKLLKHNGIYFSTDLGFLCQNPLLALCTSIIGRKKVKFPIPKHSKREITFFKELIEAGKYKAVIDRCYPMEKIVEAYSYVETGQKTGNVVITLLQ